MILKGSTLTHDIMAFTTAWIELVLLHNLSLSFSRVWDTTFVSHCWGAPWGSLVTAITSGSCDPNRRVWCDLFAVRQWEGSEAGHCDYRPILDKSHGSHLLPSGSSLTCVWQVQAWSW
jgi:hypothetical protein